MSDIREAVVNGQTTLGIELGSTRIKAVLIDDSYKVIASGSWDWERPAGKLQSPEGGCKKEIRRDPDEGGSDRNQRHDAWISGI